jgi:membrane-bound inhibitor of C-type lysozyme
MPLPHCRLALQPLSCVLIGLMPVTAPAMPAAAPEPEPAIRATYLCRGRFDAVELTALFFNRDPSEVILLVGETATRLPRQLSASGSRYGGGNQEFWIKGEQASWRLGPHPAATMRCQTTSAQSQR